MIKEFNKLSKEDLIEVLRIALNNIDRLEKENKLLYKTEKERLKLFKENKGLKGEIGLLKAVKILMQKSSIYGYEDLIIIMEDLK